jgi:mono/diheme cytochrome c family protein
MKNELAVTAAAMVVVALRVPAYAADPQAGKAAAEAKCAQCHAARDWEGEDAASLESLIHDIVAGTVKHKVKLQLSPAEIANIAAYWDDGGKSK